MCYYLNVHFQGQKVNAILVLIREVLLNIKFPRRLCLFDYQIVSKVLKDFSAAIFRPKAVEERPGASSQKTCIL